MEDPPVLKLYQGLIIALASSLENDGLRFWVPYWLVWLSSYVALHIGLLLDTQRCLKIVTLTLLVSETIYNAVTVNLGGWTLFFRAKITRIGNFRIKVLEIKAKYLYYFILCFMHLIPTYTIPYNIRPLDRSYNFIPSFTTPNHLISSQNCYH
jgi:hypothetical protein